MLKILSTDGCETGFYGVEIPESDAGAPCGVLLGMLCQYIYKVTKWLLTHNQRIDVVPTERGDGELSHPVEMT